MRVLLNGIRQRPILPGRVQPSTFGTEGLNFCVRYGNRWDPFVIATGNCELYKMVDRLFPGPSASFRSASLRPLCFSPLPFFRLPSSLSPGSLPFPCRSSRPLHCTTLCFPCQASFVAFQFLLCASFAFCTLTTAQFHDSNPDRSN